MTTLLEDLRQFQAKRRFPDWQPKPSSSKFAPINQADYQVLLNCLSFLPLEIQVATWDRQIEADPEVSAILERNAADEDKHTVALEQLADYLSFSAPDSEALALVSRWQKSEVNPAVLMYALEMGVFFSILPTLITLGDVYAATVASWISDDERVHVETGLRLLKESGLKVSYEALELIFDTNLFIYSPLGTDKAREKAERAVKRTLSTKDPQMNTESLPVTIAYFEQTENSSIAY
jgi:hypothetical protein